MTGKSPLRLARASWSPTPSDVIAERDRHLVHFYEDEGALGELVATFLAEGLAVGEGAVVLATQAHLRLFAERLAEQGVAYDGAVASGQLAFLDAHELLTRILVDGEPCPKRFAQHLSPLVEPRARPQGGSGLRVYGELVDVLWQRGQAAAALRLEELWNELQASQPFTLLCAYVMANFYREPADVRRVCAQHTHVHHGHLRSVHALRPGIPAALASDSRDESVPSAAEIAQRAEVEAALKAALRDARRKEERLQMALHAGTMGIWEWDLSSNHVSWSPTIEAIHGIPEGSFSGTFDAYRADIHPEDRERVLENLRRIRLGDTDTSDYATQYRIVRPDGEVRWLDARGHVERDTAGAPARVVGVCTDITERKRHESEREAASRRNARLAAVITAVASAITADDVFPAVVDQLGAVLGAATGALWLREGNDATLVYSVGYRAGTESALSGPIDRPQGLPAFDVIRTSQPIWLASPADLIATYPHLEPFVTPGRGYRIACLPLRTQAETIGALGFTFEDGHAFDDDERSFLTLAAGYCAQALERLRLLDAERASRSRAEAATARMALLDRASRAFSEVGPDLSALLRTIVREVNDGYAEACGIILRADSSDELVVAAVEHRDPEGTVAVRALLEAAPLKLGQGVSGRVAESGRGVLVPHIDPASFDATEYTSYRPFLERHLPASLVAVPLRVRGRVLGTLTATRTRSTPPFEAEDLQLLQELSDRAALAIDASRLHSANQQARSRAELLYRLAAGLIGAEGLEQLFQTALDGLESALGAQRSSILAYDDDDVMRFKAWRGLSDAYRQAVEGHSPWARDVESPQPIVIPDVEENEELTALMPVFRREGIRGLAFIPLVADGRLIGKFMVYYGQPRSIDAQELELAGAIANHVAAAIVRVATIGQLERTVHLNEMFTGMLGHDLRNPLGAIMTAAQLALMREEGARLARPLGRILKAGSRMARMIDQLLDFTRVRVGDGIPLAPKAVDLVPLVRQVIDELDDARPEVPLQLHSTGDTRGSWDADRLSQVFSNLVANAAQHGVPEHGCTVHIDGTEPDRLRVDVHNHGTIAADVLPHIFEPMTGQRARDRSRGLGLGLFITQQILEAHGGTIQVRSNAESGTTFTLVLPRTLPALAKPPSNPG